MDKTTSRISWHSGSQINISVDGPILLGDQEVTANLYFNFAYQWRSRIRVPINGQPGSLSLKLPYFIRILIKG